MNWLTSYSLYLDTLEPWFAQHVAKDWVELRAKLMGLLQDEAELEEIVQLVGMDALSAPDRLKLEAARSIREDFLHRTPLTRGGHPRPPQAARHDGADPQLL